MSDHPEMSEEEEKGCVGQEGACEVPALVSSELRDDDPDLLERPQGMELLDYVGLMGNVEVEDLGEAQEMEMVAPETHEGLCPICGETGIFGVNEAWLYLLFAVLGFLMGYISTVHGSR